MIDIIGLLKTKREDVAGHVDALAERLVGGEKVSRDEIKLTLQKAEASPEELQAAVDRQTRRRELLATVRAAIPARRRLADIRHEVSIAEADFARERDRLDALVGKYAPAVADLETTVAAGDRAEVALIEPRNLPVAEAAKLKAAQDAVREADIALSDARRELPELQRQAAEAHELLADEEETRRANRGDAMAEEQLQRAKTRATTRDAKLKAAEAEIPKLDKALTAARRARDGLLADLRAKFGSASSA